MCDSLPEDLLDLAECDDRDPDVCFTTDVAGFKYEVVGWSANDKIVLGLPVHGTFNKLVMMAMPNSDQATRDVVVQRETSKCIQEAGKLLAARGGVDA